MPGSATWALDFGVVLCCYGLGTITKFSVWVLEFRSGVNTTQRFKESEQALFKPCKPDDGASPKFGLLHLVVPIISYPGSASPLILRNRHQASVGWIQYIPLLLACFQKPRYSYILKIQCHPNNKQIPKRNDFHDQLSHS